MFETIELPRPDEIAGLDDRGLVDAMAVATVVESAAVEVRLAAMEEMYARQLRAPAKTLPRPPLPQATLQRVSGRRRRRRRKRKHRR